MNLHGRNVQSGPRARRLDRITLNLASMIDVTFLILIYFLVTTVLIQPEDRLSPALQTRQAGAAVSDFQPQVVEVFDHEGQPAYRIGERIMRERAELIATLAALPKGEGIFINVSDAVPVGFAVAAMQEARNAGFEQVTYVPQQ